MAARTVLLNLIGQDRVSRMLRGVRRQVDETDESIQRFGRDSDRMSKITGKAFGNVTKRLGGLLKVGVKFASLGIGAALAISQAVNLAAALAPLAGLLAGIPAAIAVFGVALGTLKLALSGVGDAFGAALGDDPKKFEESLKGLAPAAQSVARELRALRPTLLGIRQAAQGAFFGPLQGQLRGTAAVLAGPLRTGVRSVAGEYGLAAAAGLRFAQQGRTASGLTVIFGAVQRAIAGIRPAITPVLQGFRDMAVQGAGTLSRLGAGVGNLGVRFGEWMQRFAASGGVQAALGGALTLIKSLGGVLLDLGGILRSVVTAASGSGGLLGFLGQATAQLNAFLRTAQAQAALRTFFTTMNQLGSALAPIIPILASVVGQYLSALGPILQAMTPLVGAFVRGIGTILAALTPILPALSQLATTLHQQLQPILIPLVDLIAQTAAQVGGALVQALIACMPSIKQLILSVATLLPLWAQLTPVFTSLLVALIPLLPPILRLATILITALVPVLRIAIMILTKYWSTTIGLVIPVVNKLAQVLTWVAGVIGPAIQRVGAVMTWLWQNAIKPAWNGIQTAIGVAWSLIRPVFDTIARVVRTVLGIAFTVLKNTVKIAWIAIQIAIGLAWKVIKPIFDRIQTVIRNYLAPAFSWFWNKVVSPLWNKIKGHISSVYNTGIKPVFDKLKTAVGKIGDAFSAAVSAIKRHWDKLKGVAKTPVNFVIGLYNDGIVNLVNKLASFAGVKDRLNKIPKFARGGVLPGYSPGVDSLIAAVSPGEAIMRPEFTRAVGADFVHSANNVARRTGPSGLRKWLSGPGAMGGEGLAFARGGVVPGYAGRFAFGGIIGDFVKGVKDFTIGNIGKGAEKLLDKVLGATVPGSGTFRNLLAAIPGWIKKTVVDWVKKKVTGGVGGPGVQRALQFARQHNGAPYVWGGVGPGGWDCSGWMSSLVNVIQGKNPYQRRFTTFSFTGARNGPAGFVRGLRSGLTVGVTNAGVGHMAGTLGGINVESSGSRGVHMGPSARGTSDRMFGMKYGLKFDRGGMLPEGWSRVYNGTGAPEPVLTSGQFDALAGGASRDVHVHMDNVTIRETVDVDRAMQRAGFLARSVTL
ncbi:Phage-related protein [Actinomadura madurae]|uniref:Phage-related protein n=1 Tax=Actinomadura madurae TaxID=1993 RepID=A0A1I5ESS7_9ACTN|nr:hypothetical protein [Actinomadura madurae]SFO14423.1 Phage-related protein [Actinomadura madurae]